MKVLGNLSKRGSALKDIVVILVEIFVATLSGII
jgi:hypothetical protein